MFIATLWICTRDENSKHKQFSGKWVVKSFRARGSNSTTTVAAKSQSHISLPCFMAINTKHDNNNKHLNLSEKRGCSNRKCAVHWRDYHCSMVSIARYIKYVRSLHKIVLYKHLYIFTCIYLIMCWICSVSSLFYLFDHHKFAGSSSSCSSSEDYEIDSNRIIIGI